MLGWGLREAEELGREQHQLGCEVLRSQQENCGVNVVTIALCPAPR